jgi:hypothetical protein
MSSFVSPLFWEASTHLSQDDYLFSGTHMMSMYLPRFKWEISKMLTKEYKHDLIQKE